MIRPTVEVLLSMVDQLSAPLRSTAQGVQGIASGLSNAVKGMAAAALGYVTADFFKDSVQEAMAAEQATSRLGLAVSNTGASFQEWGPKVDESIGKLTKLTRFGDDDFKAAMTNMVSKSGDVKGSLGNMGLAADIAAMKGISLADAGDLVGKVMAGNTKPLKEFGITASSSADGMAQLREKTAGYAEKDLTTLSGKLAQAKTNFSEVKEQIGSVLLGTEGLGGGVSGLSQFLADLAGWIEENRAGFTQLTDTLKVVGEGLLDAGKAVWSVIKAVWDAVDAIVGWGNIWRGLQISVVLVTSVVEAFAGKVQWVVGTVTVALGKMLELAAPLLDKFGLGVGAAAENMLKIGQRLQKEGDKAFTESAEKAHDKILMIAASGQEAQKKLTKTYAEGAAARGDVVDRETKDEVKVRADSSKKLEELEKLAFKGQMTILSAQQREYEELVKVFQDKMQGMTKADHARAETLLRESHTRLLLKWGGLAKELEPAVITPINRILHSTTLLSGEIEKAADRMPMQRFYELQRIASEIGPAIQDAAGDILQFSDSLGIVSPRLDSIVGGISSLGQGLASFGSGDILGGFTAGLAGFSSVLGGIFGDSPADKARKELLAKNNQRLAELKDELGTLLNLNTTGAKIEAFQGVDIGALLNATLDRKSGGVGIGQLGRFLAKQGLGLKDFQGLAEELGIDLASDGKNFNANAVADLLSFVKANRFTGFDNSIEGRVESLDFQNMAAGGGDREALQGLARLFSEPGNAPALGRVFAGLNASDGVDDIEVAVIRQRAMALASDFSNGQLSEGDLGNLTNSQFKQLFERMIGLLESVSDNTSVAADAGAATAAATAATASAVSGTTYAEKLDTILADMLTATTTNQGG